MVLILEQCICDAKYTVDEVSSSLKVRSMPFGIASTSWFKEWEVETRHTHTRTHTSHKPVSDSDGYSESESRSVMSNSLRPQGLYSPWNSPGQNTEVGSHSLLQGIFPIQESNQGFLHCRWILYQLSYQGSPNKLHIWGPSNDVVFFYIKYIILRVELQKQYPFILSTSIRWSGIVSNISPTQLGGGTLASKWRYASSSRSPEPIYKTSRRPSVEES